MICTSIEEVDAALRNYSTLLVADGITEEVRTKLLRKIDYYLDTRLDMMILEGNTTPELELING